MLSIRRFMVVLVGLALVACEQVVLVGPVGDASMTVTELRTGAQMALGSANSEADVIELRGQAEYDALSDIAKLRQLGQTRYTMDVTYEADTWYVITADGGFDFDPDGDLQLDAGTQVAGSLHGIYKGSTLNASGFAISPLTEALYQWIVEHIDILDDGEVQAALDEGAAQLIGDVDNSGVTDYADVLIANPTMNIWALTSPAAVASLSSAIADGDSEATIDERARALFSAGSPGGVPEARYVTVDSALASRCGACHHPGGVGFNSSDNKLQPPTNPDYVSANTENFRNLVDSQGVDYLLGKVSGGISHSGGSPWRVGTADYIAFEEWLKLL